jgi:hypothetical protein
MNFTDLSMVANFFLPFWAHLASKFAKTTNSVRKIHADFKTVKKCKKVS